MGDSGKGGGGGEQKYFGTIAVLGGKGPWLALDAIILNGEVAWEGPLYRSETTNPVTIVLPGGNFRWRWGTLDQTPDATLNGFDEHPAYAGRAYGIFVDFDHGGQPNAYNIEVIGRCGCEQTVVTGAPAAEDLDDAYTVNAAVHAAEVLTSPSWLGLPDSALNAATFQALAEDLQSEIPDVAHPERSLTALSPLYTDAAPMRAVLAGILGPADAWLRLGADGRIEAGRWRRDGAPPEVTTLTYDDLSDWPDHAGDEADAAPNCYAIEFTDSEALHKGAKISVPDLGRLAAGEPLHQATIKATALITVDQALRLGQDALHRVSPGGSWAGSVRRSRAVTPEGDRIRPGDYLRVPVSAPGQPLQTRLLRIEKVTTPRAPSAPVKVAGRFDPGGIAALSTTNESNASGSANGVVMPPVVYCRVFALPAESPGETPPIRILAARPHNLAVGVDVFYDDSAMGDFPPVGQQRAFALPLGLYASFSDSATTVRVSLLAPDGDGAIATRDAHMLTDWTGGETEGRDDELLLVLLRKSSGDVILQPGDQHAWLEVMSVDGSPSIVSAGVYDVPVLRGRLQTTPLAFTAGSFPDAWSGYEAWLIPQAALAQLSHADFDSMLSTGAVGYFRVGAFAAREQYSPAAAFAELERLQDASLPELEYAQQPDADEWLPELEYEMPPGLNVPEIVGGETYDEI